MTKVFQILEEEKQEAINLAEQKRTIEIAENLLKDGFDTAVIVRATGLSEEKIEEIRNNMLISK